MSNLKAPEARWHGEPRIFSGVPSFSMIFIIEWAGSVRQRKFDFGAWVARIRGVQFVISPA
jgi:hypothetical protein